MSDNLRAITHEATQGISDLLGDQLNDEQSAKIHEIVEAAVIRSLLEGQHSAVDAALQYPEADQDLAHKIASEIRRKNDLLIVNLTSLR